MFDETFPNPPIGQWLSEVGIATDPLREGILACRIKMWALKFSSAEVEAALEDAFAAVQHSFDRIGAKADD